MKSIQKITEGEVVAIDGKTLRGSYDKSSDQSAIQIRKDNAPQNMAILRQIAVNLLGKEKRVKLGIKNKQFMAAMDNKYLERVLALA